MAARGAKDDQMRYFTPAGRLHSSLHCCLGARASVGAAAAAFVSCTSLTAGQPETAA
jgi:hypothetical protein